jgi:1,4-alpha-glucan branching enzyme
VNILYNFDLDLFVTGNTSDAYKFFGAHATNVKGVKGYLFNLYAPNAHAVEVVGDFNGWVGSKHQMSKHSWQGVWQIFIPNLPEYTAYKYNICQKNGNWALKADPYAFYAEHRPNTASKTFDIQGFPWQDKKYMEKRDKHFNKAFSIYELHLNSWVRDFDNRVFSYEEIAQKIVDYIKDNNYTHIELLPVMEHPLDESWGYQVSGFFAITSRYGNPKQLMYLVDLCHQNNIGVIFDFVGVHFVKDDFGLYKFDGSRLYEYPDESRRKNSWGTSNFDYSKGPVRSFIMSCIGYYAEMYHVDGVRFDAISNMIYYQGNKSIGENIDGTNFLKQMNFEMNKAFPSLILIAEDSSDYQGVTKPVEFGGLGFDYKWDLGWMNDTLKYYALDPLFRKFEHHKITFSMFYFYSEHFILPFSHDEVVHGKGTIINKLWGSYEQKFQQLRNLYAYMFTHPGKKLNFMGNDLAMFREWNEKTPVDWNLMDYPVHRSFHDYVRDLNHLYKDNKALHHEEFNPELFKWIVVNNSDQSIFSYYRQVGDNIIMVILNMTPNLYDYYEMGVPLKGEYVEVINSDDVKYGGYGFTNQGSRLNSGGTDLDGCGQRLGFKLAPFGAIILKYKGK